MRAFFLIDEENSVFERKSKDVTSDSPHQKENTSNSSVACDMDVEIRIQACYH
jgi:hypothetical protein